MSLLWVLAASFDPTSERAHVMAATPISRMGAQFHARDQVTHLAGQYGVPTPEVFMDYPVASIWRGGRHAEYHPNAIYIPEPNSAIDHVVAHEFVHHLEHHGLVERPDGQSHGPGFYEALDDVKSRLGSPWESSPRRSQFGED